MKRHKNLWTVVLLVVLTVVAKLVMEAIHTAFDLPGWTWVSYVGYWLVWMAGLMLFVVLMYWLERRKKWGH